VPREEDRLEKVRRSLAWTLERWAGRAGKDLLREAYDLVNKPGDPQYLFQDLEQLAGYDGCDDDEEYRYRRRGDDTEEDEDLANRIRAYVRSGRGLDGLLKRAGVR